MARAELRREYERKLRENAKAMGMTYLEYREYRRNNPQPREHKPPVGMSGRPRFSVREVHDKLIEEQPFLQPLKTLQDTGRTRPTCPACKRVSDFDDYFCMHCGEHFDWLYCYEHAQAPITLTREQIEAEYEAAGRPFVGQKYTEGQLKFYTIQDLTGVNPYATMPVETHKEEDRWKGLKGFSPTT